MAEISKIEQKSLENSDSQKAKKYNFLIKNAFDCVRDNKFGEAIKNFKKIVGIENNKSPMIRSFFLSMLAWCYINIRHYKEGFRWLYKSFVESSSNEDSHFILNLLFEAKKTPFTVTEIKIEKNKLSSIEKAFEKRNDFASHVVLSLINCFDENFDGMERHLTLASKIAPNNPYLFYYRTKCYVLRKEYSVAISLFNEIDITRPEFNDFRFDYFYNMHNCYSFLLLDCFQKDNIDNAKKVLADSIKFTSNIKTELEDKKIDENLTAMINNFERKLVLFDEIINFDAEFKMIPESKTLNDLLGKLLKLSDFLVNNRGILDRYSEMLKHQEKDVLDIAVVVGFVKGYCVLSLIKHFEFVFLEDKKNDSLVMRYINPPKFDFCRKQLLHVGFIKGKQGIDAIENFVSVLLSCTKKEAILKEKELILLLKPAYVLDGELSKYLAEREFREDRLKSLEESFQDTQRKNTTMILRAMKSTIRSLKKEIISNKVSEVSKQKAGGGKAKYEKIEIDFSDSKEIRIGNKKVVPMVSKRGIKQEFLLLEEILNNKGEIHWSSGFVLFREWQKYVPKRGPIAQFWSVVSGLNGEILGFELIIDSKKKEGCWTLNPDIEVKSTIEEANKLCEEAEKEERNDAIDKLKNALSLYPESIKAWKLLVDIMQKHQDKLLDRENLLLGLEVFRKRGENLDAAIKRIQIEGDKQEWGGIWKGIQTYHLRMCDELKEIESYKYLIQKIWEGVKVEDDEAKCNTILGLIDDIRKSDTSTEATNAKFIELLDDRFIKECISSASKIILGELRRKGIKGVEHREVEDVAKSKLWFLFREHPIRNKGAQAFKNYLNTSLKYRVMDEIKKDLHEKGVFIDFDERHLYPDNREKDDDKETNEI